MKRTGEPYSLKDIIYRIIMDLHENFENRQHEDLMPVDEDGFDTSNDITLANLDALKSEDLPLLPKTMTIATDGPVDTVMRIMQELTTTYCLPRHFENHYTRQRFSVARSAVTKLDGKDLYNMSPDVAQKIVKESFERAKNGGTLMITGLDKLSEFRPANAVQGFHALSSIVARGAIIKEMIKPDRNCLVVFADKYENIQQFYNADVLNDFYDYAFDSKEHPYTIYQYLQHFIRTDKDRRDIAGSLSNSTPRAYKEILKQFESEVRAKLVHDKDIAMKPEHFFVVPKFVGSDLAMQLYTMFERNDFVLTPKARHCFLHHMVEMSLNHGGKGFHDETDAVTAQQEIDVFAAVTIGCAVDRIAAKSGEDEFCLLYNLLSDDKLTLPKIKRVIEEEDVLDAVRVLRGLQLNDRTFFSRARRSASFQYR